MLMLSKASIWKLVAVPSEGCKVVWVIGKIDNKQAAFPDALEYFTSNNMSVGIERGFPFLLQAFFYSTA